MKLSVIFINQNSRNGLKLALNTLLSASAGIDYEVIVIDNGSTDRSLEMLAFEFPSVRIISNAAYEGVSRVCNKAINAAKGKYVLLLSPYILTSADSLKKLVAFMDEHPLTGGASARIVNYKGDYLSESKHSLSKSWAAFLKLVGMGAYFPRSISAYKRGDWVEEFETSEVDVLHEDCMLLRRSAIEKTGLFDERFRHYGHNIDLSCRLRQKGFKTYYYSKTYIIQLPGRSVNKFSWEYISQFYGAMFIFAAKYLFKLPVINVETIGEILPSSYEIE
ncbi:MAG TPA: glycosyltransferase [Mucilaginibacter sp.]|nr:glycosyltransferase [Mucilaginibacter sp.]